MNKIKSFVKQFVAVVKGDDAEATAQKALRQADSALKTQIAILNGNTVGYEDAVTVAKEAQALARVNGGKSITDRDYYVESLLESKNAVTEAEEDLKLHQEKIAFLEAELEALDNEEEVKA
jgi:hypothetical protein